MVFKERCDFKASSCTSPSACLSVFYMLTLFLIVNDKGGLPPCLSCQSMVGSNLNLFCAQCDFNKLFQSVIGLKPVGFSSLGF